MAKFVFAYTGGSMAETPEARDEAMQRWGSWFGQLGPASIDGGNPFGASAAIGPDGSATPAAGLSGYSIIEADDLAAATGLAGGCPVLASGGNVEVYEALPM